MISQMDDFQEEFKKHDFSTPIFSLNGLKTYGRLVDVLDGDTIVCVLPVFNEFFKFHLRLNGIDTCEIKSKDSEVKQRALLARQKVLEFLCQKSDLIGDIQNLLKETVVVVWVKCLRFDKFGRVLAEVYQTQEAETSVSEYLLREGIAYPYDGGKKIEITKDVPEIFTK